MYVSCLPASVKALVTAHNSCRFACCHTSLECCSQSICQLCLCVGATSAVRDISSDKEVSALYHPKLQPCPDLQAAGDAAVRAAMPNATIFKPGPLIGNEDRLTNNIAQLGKKYPVVPLVGGGRMRMQPVYVRDVADGMINSLRSRDALGKDYHMAGPEVITCAPRLRASVNCGAHRLVCAEPPLVQRHHAVLDCTVRGGLRVLI